MATLGGVVHITEGIASLDISTINEIYMAVGRFDALNPDNGPHGEHDCAILTVSGIKVLWKVDCYDRSRQYLSPDPAEQRLTGGAPCFKEAAWVTTHSGPGALHLIK